MNHIVFMGAFCAAGSLLAAAPDLSQFEIDPRLQIGLFAAEPDVVDPVALTFDEAGRMYVVEMRDYPYGIGPEKKPGGTVRLLEDTDFNGKADKSTVFAKDLQFPTSIAPWNGGVFVTAPPDILYLKDTNGDGVADVREVWFTGFELGVTDSNVNGLRWGLDNRIHGLSSGNGGTVTSPKKPQLRVTLGIADFSFNPVDWDFTSTYQSSSGFGVVFDEFGRSFVTHNINHVQQRILPLDSLWRFPGMLPVDATRSISDHGDMARIFPISVAQTRPNHPEQAGHFSASGGVGFIGYDVYPDDLYRSFTVGDAVGNIVHRDVLTTNGPIFKASRATNETAREFIATRDSDARLVGLELGPDGGLYLIDMQREVIEHPDYIPEKMRNKGNIRAGDDRGRIYRITPKEGLSIPVLNLAKASTSELISELGHHNQWRRMTAHRLLLERNDRAVSGRLMAVLRTSYAPARVHAMWILHAWRGLADNDLVLRLKDENEGVVENALRISENYPPRWQGDPLMAERVKLAKHPSPRVRMQAALTLGALEGEAAQNAVIELLLADKAIYWNRIAALSSLRDPAGALPRILIRLRDDETNEGLELIRDVTDLAVARVDKPAAQIIEVVTALERGSNAHAVAGLEGLDRGLGRKGINQPRLAIQPVFSRIASKSDELFVATWRLSKRIGLPETAEQKSALNEAKKLALDAGTERAVRLGAIDRLRFGNYREVREALAANLNERSDAGIQTAAVNALRGFREPEVAEFLISRWPYLAPSLRTSVLDLLLSRRPFHNALITAIEKGDLKLGELNLDLEQRRTLLRHSSPDIHARAAKFIGDEEYSNRKSIAEEWLANLPERGDKAQGKMLFGELCAQCHRAGDMGHMVGPDLTSIAHRSVEDILYNILDPNMAINPAYSNYQVETTTGDLLSGILVSESPQEVTLLQANEVKTTIARKEIARMRSTGTSLMPEGLEGGMTRQQMRDLISFLQETK